MNITEVSEELNRIAQKISKPEKLSKAGTLAAETIRKHLYEGDGFEPLSKVTSDYRGKGKPLQDTGSLRDSITAELVNKNTVSVGTNKVYAPIQNNGGTITAKKQWLWIPGPRMRSYQRRYGYDVKDVLEGLRSEDFYVYRVGRTIQYREKKKGSTAHIAFYLKKSVEIPKREFFYLSDRELQQIVDEVFDEIL